MTASPLDLSCGQCPEGAAAYDAKHDDELRRLYAMIGKLTLPACLLAA